MASYQKFGEITQEDVDKALSSSPELSAELRAAKFIPAFGDSSRRVSDFAFMGCSQMQLKKLPPQLTAVGNGAFKDCTGLTEFELPGMLSIGNEMFRGCTSLSSFKFHGSNTKIGEYAFDKTAIQTAILPSTLVEVSKDTFTNCYSLLSISGSDVSSISRYAIENCPKLSAIDMPKLKTVGFKAFANVGFKDLELSSVETVADCPLYLCMKLESVNLPSCLSAGSHNYGLLFDGIYSPLLSATSFARLHTVSLPKLRHLETGIAYNCKALSAADLRSLEEFGVENHIPLLMFYDCPMLTSLDLPRLSAVNDATIAYQCDGIRTMSLPRLSDAYNLNGGLAASCSALTSISIPQLTSLGNGIATDCMNIASVYISNDVLHSINDGQIITPTSSDNEWLWISPKLDHMHSNTLTSLPSGDYAKTVKYVDCKNVADAQLDFSGNEALQYVNLPSLSVADMPFSNCKSLLSLDFSNAKCLFCSPDKLDPDALDIDRQCLYGCTSLTAIKLPENGMRAIGYSHDISDGYAIGTFGSTPLYYDQALAGKQVFELNGRYCISCIDIDISSYESTDALLIGPMAFYGSSIERVDCPNCKAVNFQAFYKTQLQDAKLGNAEFIDFEAFCDCQSLTSIECLQVKEIGERAFNSNWKLSSIECPWVKKIGNQAFYDTDISSIECPQVKEIGDKAFYGSYNLLALNVPECSSIGSRALYACLSLSSAICSSLKCLQTQTFCKCNSLKWLDIASVKTIKSQAILSCPSLLSIVMSALTAVPSVEGTPFSDLNNDCKVYVNKSIYNDMLSTGWWSTISSRIVAI